MLSLFYRVFKGYYSGQVRGFLKLLPIFSLFSSRARRFERRLKDVWDYSHNDGLFSQNKNSTCKVKYNGSVLFCIHSSGCFHPSGYASRTIALLQALKRKEVDPVVAIRPGYPWDLKGAERFAKTDLIEYQGIPFHLFPNAKSTLRSPESEYINSYSRLLVELANNSTASIVHASSNYLNGSAAALASKKLGVPSIYEVRGLWHLTRAFYNQRYKDSEHYHYCEKREVDTCRGVDHVIALSDGLKEWLVQRGVVDTKISVVGNATFLPDWSLATDDTVHMLRRKYGLSPGVPVLGYLGSLVEYEGLDILIRLLASTIPARRPYLLLVGGGRQKKTLENLANSLSLSRWVIFSGPVEKVVVSAHYRLMDLVALPRRESPLTNIVPPIKPFEVVAHRRPLIVSPSVANALGSTLSGGYSVVDFHQVGTMDELIGFAELDLKFAMVPTWDNRADQILQVYRSLSA